MNLPITSWKRTLRQLGYRVKRNRLFGNRGPASLPPENDSLSVVVLEQRHMLSVAVDFEHDSDGIALSAGEIITNQWAADGVFVTTDDPANHPAMIFDSANITGGDVDLGTPNVDFGGPGIGVGGGLGAPGVNANALGNVLILSEDNDSADPNDRSEGGTFIFDFDSSVSVEQIELLDR